MRGTKKKEENKKGKERKKKRKKGKEKKKKKREKNIGVISVLLRKLMGTE